MKSKCDEIDLLLALRPAEETSQGARQMIGSQIDRGWPN
jgi:hypothetical protein